VTDGRVHPLAGRIRPVLPNQPPPTPSSENSIGSSAGRNESRAASAERPEFEGFARERQTYEAHKADLLQSEGQFVLIKGGDVLGVWPTFEETLEAGYERLGLQPFYVREIVPAGRITRDVFPCPT
jgi:hypothetical protein